MTGRFGGRHRAAVLTSLGAAIALIGGWTYAAALHPAGFDARTDSISALAAADTAHRWAMTGALVLTGLGHLGTAALLGSARTRGRALLALAGLATLGVAAAPQSAPGVSTPLHTALAGLAFGALAAWPWFASRTRPDAAWPLRRPVARTASGVLGVGVASLLIPTASFGWHERVVAAATVLWPLVTAASVWWSAGHRIGPRAVRYGLGVGVLALLAGLGGVAATALLPVTADTRHYAATLSLTAAPTATGDLTTVTPFGDLMLQFRGPAPGVQVLPTVKPSIADLLARPGVSLSTLQPGPAELEAAIRSGVLGLGLRFVLGSLVVALLPLGAALVLRRAGRRRLLVTGLAASLLADAALAAAAYATYRPDAAHEMRTTGVLSVVQSRADLLQDVEARSAQVAPYLRNLVALSAALQSRYAPAPLTSDAALRVLLVSDLHAGNQFALMKTLIAEEQIDLVIDAGDLVTFGTVTEAEAAGFFRDLPTLGVPYLFVRGNHDATSATDRALLNRLARVPNVLLLGGGDDYTEVTAHGIRIGGFDDPRWFGDAGGRQTEAQHAARDRFLAAFAGRPELDVVVGHEPWSLDDVPAGVRLNGHMHTADLDGNRVQAGTFTGGGPLSHYYAATDGGELVGQPNAFDVLTFGPSCRLSSLKRFRFRDLLEGRPAYEEVALLNGDRIDTRPIEVGRTCARGGGIQVTTVPGAVVGGPNPSN